MTQMDRILLMLICAYYHHRHQFELHARTWDPSDRHGHTFWTVLFRLSKAFQCHHIKCDVRPTLIPFPPLSSPIHYLEWRNSMHSAPQFHNPWTHVSCWDLQATLWGPCGRCCEASPSNPSFPFLLEMFLHLWPGKKILRSPAKLYKVGYGDLDRFVYAHSSLDHLCQYGNDVHDLKLINMD